MKLNLFLIIILGLFMTACSNKPAEQPKTEPKQSQQDEPKKENSTQRGRAPECYRFLGAKDSTYLQLSEVYGTMTGLLLYKNAKKDETLGTLQGRMSGDLLIADYSYKFEGKSSTRQVVFKKKGEDYVEGQGDASTVNGKTVFKDVNSLKFNDAAALKKVPCKN